MRFNVIVTPLINGGYDGVRRRAICGELLPRSRRVRPAREAGLSPYHFLRTFEQVTGITPHQYILRARLREAAMRLAAEAGKVLDIAFDCGFGDVSNFNRAFRSEFGVSPRTYRQIDVPSHR